MSADLPFQGSLGGADSIDHAPPYCGINSEGFLREVQNLSVVWGFWVMHIPCRVTIASSDRFGQKVTVIDSERSFRRLYGTDSKHFKPPTVLKSVTLERSLKRSSM